MKPGLKKYWVSISYQLPNSIDNWSIDCQTIVYQLKFDNQFYRLVMSGRQWILLLDFIDSILPIQVLTSCSDTLISLVKLCFQLSFLLEKCICLFYKRKQSRVKFILSTIFELFANSVCQFMLRFNVQASLANEMIIPQPGFNSSQYIKKLEGE